MDTTFTLTVAGEGPLGIVLNVDLATCNGVISGACSPNGAIEREHPQTLMEGDRLTAVNGEECITMRGFDGDGDGHIDRDELVRALGAEGSVLREVWVLHAGGKGSEASDAELADAILDEFDADRDGSLSEEEIPAFLQLMLNVAVQKIAVSERPMTLTFVRKAAQQRLALQRQQQATQQQQLLQQQQMALHAQRTASARSGAEEKAATLAFVDDFRTVKKQLACVRMICSSSLATASVHRPSPAACPLRVVSPRQARARGASATRGASRELGSRLRRRKRRATARVPRRDRRGADARRGQSRQSSGEYPGRGSVARALRAGRAVAALPARGERKNGVGGAECGHCDYCVAERSVFVYVPLHFTRILLTF